MINNLSKKILDLAKKKLSFCKRVRFPAFLFIFAFVARAIYSYHFQWLAGDSHDYIELANGISRFEFSLDGNPTSFRPPLYPLLISIFPALPLNWTLDGLTAMMVYMLAKGAERERESKIAGLLFAVSPLSIHFSATWMTEALFTALIVCGMWLWRSNKIIASGIAFGFGMLTRPIVLPMLVLAVLVELLVRKSLRPILIILTLCLLVSAPWMIRNSLLEGEITLTQKSALGTNLLYGTFTREEFGTDIWTQALNRFKRCDNECAFEVAIERIKNGNWIRARLEQYPRLIIDTGTSLSPEFAMGPTSLRVIYIFLQIIGIVLAIIGIKSQPIQVWLTPAFLLIFHLPLWIEARYFLPAIPFISIMTAVGMIRVYDRYSKGYILLLGK